MARCTAPSRGHYTSSGAAACPACGGRSRGYRYGGGSNAYSYLPSSYLPARSIGGGGSSGGGSSSVRPRWSRGGSSVSYTPAQVQNLTPVRESVENLAKQPDLRDVFLCHAWDDRKGPAKELHDLLE